MSRFWFEEAAVGRAHNLIYVRITDVVVEKQHFMEKELNGSHGMEVSS